MNTPDWELSRREFVVGAAASSVIVATPFLGPAQAAGGTPHAAPTM